MCKLLYLTLDISCSQFCIAMPPSSSLHSFFDSLTAAEIAYLPRRLRGKKLTLFLELLQEKKSATVKGISSLASMAPKALATLRAKLEADVVRLRSEFKLRNIPSERLRPLRLLAMGFQASGSQVKAINTYKKAAALATELEDHHQAAELLGAILLMIDEKAPAAAPFVNAQKEAIDRYTEVSRYFGFVQESQGFKQMVEAERTLAAANMLKNLERIPAPSSTKAKLHSARVQTLCLVLMDRFDEAYPILEAARKSCLAMPCLLYDWMAMQSLVAVHLSLSGYHVNKGNAVTASQLLDQFVDLLDEQGLEIPSLIRLEIETTQIFVAWEAQDWARVERLSGHLFEALGAGQYQNANRRLVITIDFAARYMAVGNVQKALQCVERAYLDRREEVLPEGLASAAIMELAGLVEIQDWERLDRVIPNATYLLESRSQLNDYTRLLLKAFREISRHPQSVIPTLTQLDLDLDALENLQGKTFLATIFDMKGWIVRQCLK